jgi:hypothetical protein
MLSGCPSSHSSSSPNALRARRALDAGYGSSRYSAYSVASSSVRPLTGMRQTGPSQSSAVRLVMISVLRPCSDSQARKS